MRPSSYVRIHTDITYTGCRVYFECGTDDRGWYLSRPWLQRLHSQNSAVIVVKCVIRRSRYNLFEDRSISHTLRIYLSMFANDFDTVAKFKALSKLNPLKYEISSRIKIL